MEKDYSLLRPFDLEKAKAGEAIAQCGGNTAEIRWIARSGNNKMNIVEYRTVASGNVVSYMSDEHLYMSPLAWVEGKPVYKGDLLHSDIGPRIIVGFDGKHLRGVVEENAPWGLFSPENLTWTPPKKTREVKLLGYLTGDGLLMHVTERYCVGDKWLRVPSEDRTVTVEE